MKKFVKIILSFILCFSVCFSVACKSNDNASGGETPKTDVVTLKVVSTSGEVLETKTVDYQEETTLASIASGVTTNIDKKHSSGFFADEALTQFVSELTVVENKKTYYANYITDEEIEETLSFDGKKVQCKSTSITNQVIAIPQKSPAGSEIKNIAQNKNGELGFANLVSLKKIILPATIIKIGDYAFQGSSNLVTVSIPTTIKVASSEDSNIGSYAFLNCSALKTFVVPEGIKYVKQHAFENCTSLTTVSLPTTFVAWEKSDNEIEIAEKTFYNCTSLTEINIPSNITAIRQSAFDKCSSLEKIDLPDGLKIIEKQGIAQCKNLAYIIVPESVEEIGVDAFKEVKKLKVYVEATEEQSGWAENWNRIKSSETNLYEVAYYSEEEPAGDGLFWHYENNAPVIWQ